jgi:hypothetical protein
MKKYLVLAGLFALIAAVIPATQAKAQWAVPKAMTTTAYGNALDTVDNTEQHVTTTSEGRVATWKTGMTATVAVLKISGTVGGTLALQGSMDGTNWVTIGNAATPSDASANYSFNTTVRFYYYRISYTGTGTMSASMRSHLFAY